MDNPSREEEEDKVEGQTTSETTPTENNGGIDPSDPNPSTSNNPEATPEETPKNPSPKPGSEPIDVESTENPIKTEPLVSEDVSLGSISKDEQNPEKPDKKQAKENERDDRPSKKQKSFTQIDNMEQPQLAKTPASGSSKKSSKKKSKGNNVWTKPTSRKGKKKANNNNNNNNNGVYTGDGAVLISPIMRLPDKKDDSPYSKVCLSKINKAEKVELSEDRLSAGSCKGYRMVRATRGIVEGAWYFEIKVVNLGETGHTRLGWSTEKGDLQAPVGYDSHSFGYRDIDGSKIHKASREKYGEEGYKEGDVIGFYINLPNGSSYAPKLPQLVWYKGQKYICAPKPEEPPKIVPGSQISFFKNGICQGVAFKDLCGGRYYPAASMFTLPNQSNCVVKFNFGPDFDCLPTDFGDSQVPRPMIEVPYHGFDNAVENVALHDNKQ